jgi:ubiquinone/menaquinone biosynthesis C-methylase UbiE
MGAHELFDGHAQNYADTVNTRLRSSGEDVAFFARLKAQLVAREMAHDVPRTVLDFGCGIGLGTTAVATALPRSQVMGCDPSEESVKQAKATLTSTPRVRFVPFGGDTLPFDAASFDVVFTSCVFHHIERPSHAWWISEIVRVLKPGGAFFIFEHNPFNPLTRRVVASCPFDRGVVLLGPRYTHALLRHGGLAVTRPKFYFFFPHFLAPLRRFEYLLDWCPVGAQYYVRGTRPL